MKGSSALVRKVQKARGDLGVFACACSCVHICGVSQGRVGERRAVTEDWKPDKNLEVSPEMQSSSCPPAPHASACCFLELIHLTAGSHPLAPSWILPTRASRGRPEGWRRAGSLQDHPLHRAASSTARRHSSGPGMGGQRLPWAPGHCTVLCGSPHPVPGWMCHLFPHSTWPNTKT